MFRVLRAFSTAQLVTGEGSSKAMGTIGYVALALSTVIHSTSEGGGAKKGVKVAELAYQDSFENLSSLLKKLKR